MIVVWGSLEDPPVARVIEELDARTSAVVHLDDDSLAEIEYDVVLDASPSGWLVADGERVDLGQVRGLYLRPGSRSDHRHAAAAATFLAVAAALPATVVNRPAAGRSNWSKPYQLGLLRDAGFAVPDTLVTTDPVAAKQFLADHGRVVYKSVSGIRSIVSSLGPDEADRLDGVVSGPVQLQQWVDGCDVRVHVVGDRCFGTAVASEADDYRYAHLTGKDVLLEPFDVPSAVAEQLRAITRSMGLVLAGADLRLDADGGWWALEVNPSPGFTYYEEAGGQPIAAAVAELLLR